MLRETARRLRVIPPPTAVAVAQRQLVRVGALALKLSLLDDVFGTGKPILRLQLNVSPSTLYRSHERQGVAGLRLTAACDYFNVRAEAWEPVLEDLALTVVRRAALDDGVAVNEIIADGGLTTLNVSVELVDLLQHIGGNLSGIRSAAVMPNFLRETEVVLRSRVSFGLSLELQYGGDRRETVSLAGGQQQAIFASTTRLRRHRAIRRICVSAEMGNAVRQVGVIDPHVQGTSTMAIALAGQPPFELYVACTREKNMPIIEIYSLYCIRNSTARDLRLKLLHHGRFQSIDLCGGAEVVVPPFFFDGGFALKPAQKQLYSNAIFFDRPAARSAQRRRLLRGRDGKGSAPPVSTYPPQSRSATARRSPLRSTFDHQGDAHEQLVTPSAPAQLYVDPVALVAIRLCVGGMGSAALKLPVGGRVPVPLIDLQQREVATFALQVTRGTRLRLDIFPEALIINELGGGVSFSQVLARREVQNQIISSSRETGRELRCLSAAQDVSFLDRASGAQLLVPVRRGQHDYDLLAEGKLAEQISVTGEEVVLDEALGIRQTVLTFKPKYVFCNSSEFALALRSPRIAAGEAAFPARSRQKLALLGCPGLFQLRHAQSRWSEPFELTRLGFAQMSLSKRDVRGLDHLSVEVSDIDGCLFILVQPSQGTCLIRNQLASLALLVFQTAECAERLDCDAEVAPTTTLEYSWRCPEWPASALHFLFVEAGGGGVAAGWWQTKAAELAARPGRDSHTFPFRLELNRDRHKQQLRVGPLLVYAELGEHRGQTCVSFTSIADSPADGGTAVEELQVSALRLGISLICGQGRRRRELAFVCAEGVRVEFSHTASSRELSVAVADVQVDYNANPASRFPVLLGACEPATQLRSLPLLALRVGLSRLDAQGLAVFSLVEICVHPLRLSLEEDLLAQVMLLLEDVGGDTAARVAFLQTKFAATTASPAELYGPSWQKATVVGSRPAYFRRFALSNVEVRLSVAKSLVREDKGELHTRALLSALKALAHIDDLRVVLPALALNNESNTLAAIGAKLRQHYQSQLLAAGAKLLGSSELMGNPAKLADELAAGLRDFVRLSERHGLEGLLGGAKSLLRHTLAGSLGVVNRMARTLGDGFSYLTADRAYLVARSQPAAG